MMHNLTLAVDADVLLEARKLALERGTSVNELVREYLERLVRESEGAARAADALEAHARQHAGTSRGLRWTRDQLNER